MFPLLRADEAGRAGSTGPTTRECVTANWPNTKCRGPVATSSTCRPVWVAGCPIAANDLWITEGTKKADCGAERGLCIVAINGVYGWLSKGVGTAGLA